MTPPSGMSKSAPQGKTLAQIEQRLDPTVEIGQLLQANQIDRAFNVALSSSKVEVVMWLVSQVASDRIFGQTPCPLSKACCCRWCNRCRLIYRRQTLQRSSIGSRLFSPSIRRSRVASAHASGAQHGAPGADGRRQLTQKRARGSRRNAAVYSRRQQHAFFLVILIYQRCYFVSVTRVNDSR